MDQEWQVIPIEDVRPGDVARCNGREWSVVSDPKGQFKVELSQWLEYSRLWYGWKALGFTFHRKVKREPRVFREFAVVNSRGTLVGTRSLLADAENYANAIGGTYFLADITEITDEGNGA